MSDMVIPDELIEEIFSRLPAKTLIRFRCLSKPWQAVIGSPEFIKKHFTNSSNYTLIQGITKYVNDEEEGKYLYSADYDSFLKTGRADFDELNLLVPRPRFDEILGSSNGLLCVRKQNLRNDRVILWNPSTREYRRLPFPEIRRTGHSEPPVYGFGYDFVNDDYKVIVMLQIANAADNTIVQVYSLKLDSWRRVQELLYHFEYLKNGQRASGALHWVVRATSHPRSEELIAAFDLGTEEYRLLPKPDDNFCVGLGNLGVFGGYFINY